MKKAEALLPGTDALPASTLDWTTHQGKHLVRLRLKDGTTTRCHTRDPEEANRFYQEAFDRLKKEARRR